MMGRMITERVIAKAIWPIARVIPPAENADNGRTQDTGSAMQCHHKNGEADKKWQGDTASTKINQQNKPMPAKFRRSPRASMVVAP